MPEAPAELGLESEHFQAVLGLYPKGIRFTEEAGGRGVVDEVIDQKGSDWGERRE